VHRHVDTDLSAANIMSSEIHMVITYQFQFLAVIRSCYRKEATLINVHRYKQSSDKTSDIPANKEINKKFILIRSNKMQQYAGIYLMQNHSLHVSGVHRTHHQENKL
jgi:hypothetical protein